MARTACDAIAWWWHSYRATFHCVQIWAPGKSHSVFANLGNNITPEGWPYLGAAIGSERKHMRSKVEKWTATVSMLSEIAKSQPHAALTHLLPSGHSSAESSHTLATYTCTTGQHNPSQDIHHQMTCCATCLIYLLGYIGGLLPLNHADREHVFKVNQDEGTGWRI